MALNIPCQVSKHKSFKKSVDYLADKPGFYKVMNEGTPQEAVVEM